MRKNGPPTSEEATVFLNARIIDPASGRVYYTDKLNRRGNGAIVFRDRVTRSEITLSASEVVKITKDQFLADVHGR